MHGQTDKGFSMRSKGSVLVVVLGLLAILAIVGITFITMSSLDRNTATNFALQSQFDLAADGTVDYICDILAKDLWSWERGTDASGNTTFTNRLLSDPALQGGPTQATPAQQHRQLDRAVRLAGGHRPVALRRPGPREPVAHIQHARLVVVQGARRLTAVRPLRSAAQPSPPATTWPTTSASAPARASGSRPGVPVRGRPHPRQPDGPRPCRHDQPERPRQPRRRLQQLELLGKQHVGHAGRRGRQGLLRQRRRCLQQQRQFQHDLGPPGHLAPDPSRWAAGAQALRPVGDNGEIFPENPAVTATAGTGSGKTNCPFTLDEEFELRRLSDTLYQSRLRQFGAGIFNPPNNRIAYTTVGWTSLVRGDGVQVTPAHILAKADNTNEGNWSARKPDFNTDDINMIYNAMRDLAGLSDGAGGRQQEQLGRPVPGQHHRLPRCHHGLRHQAGTH